MVAHQDVLARKRTPLERNMPLFSQPDHGWRMQSQPLRMQHVADVLIYARHTLKDYHHCAPLIAHVDWLERSIQD